MEPGPLDLSDLLSHLDTRKISPAADTLHQQLLDLMRRSRLREVEQRALAAIRSEANRNDRNLQAFASAYLAAVYADACRFQEAVSAADDALLQFRRMGDMHNAMLTRALLAAVYQKHLEALGRDLADTLPAAQVGSNDMRTKALAKNQKAEADTYQQRFIQFGEQIRRARWIPAVPYALPLVWLPIIDRIAPSLETRVTEPVGFMEPLLFVLKTVDDVKRENQPDTDPSQVDDQLYTARPLPLLDGTEPSRLTPPHLKPDAVYAAVKVDPGTAHLAGLEPDDYLLVRTFTSEELNAVGQQGEEEPLSYRFLMDEEGMVKVVKPGPPRFVAEDESGMLQVKVDAVLRRVP